MATAPYLALAMILFTTSSWIPNIHATAPPSSSGESYLYNTEDSSPVLDHGLSGSDFLKSTSPKVVEFYHPRCGACRGFKYNYIEVAEKVRDRKPDVEFYGVSCEAHAALCSNYGGSSVPRIFAFPGTDSGPAGGIEVPKGAGTIYFLSGRLMKALRSPQEIAADGEMLAAAAEASGRRLFEEFGPDEEEFYDGDEYAISEDYDEEDNDGDDDDLEEDEDEGDASEDQDATEELSGDEDSLSEDRDQSEEMSEDEGKDEDDSEDNEDNASVEHSNRSEGSQYHREPSSSGKGTRDRYEDAALEDKYITQDKSRDKRASGTRYVGDDGDHYRQDPSEQRDSYRPRTKSGGRNAPHYRPDDKEGSQDHERASSHQDQQSSRTQDVSTQQTLDRLESHEQTDAYKNTLKHFERKDIEEGKEIGHHFDKWKVVRAKQISNARDARASNARGSPARNYSRPPVEGRESGDVRYAKSVFEQGGEISEKPLVNNGQPQGGPIPIEAIRNPREGTETRSRPPPHSEDTSVAVGTEERTGKRWIPPPFPRDNIPVGGDIFVPNPSNTDPVRAKKFQEYVARRAEMLERKEKMRHPIKTMLGKGASDEGDDASSIHKKSNSQYVPYNQSRQTKIPDLRPGAQHKTVREKVLKNIPIVKRAYKRSKGEETMNDAALSFTRGLLMGAFKTNKALDYKRKEALMDWFDLLRVSLPPEIGLHELLDTLKYNIDSISERRENLVTIITQHPLPDHLWSDSCTKGTKTGGFFCGFWKLLHVMSVGFAEQAGGLALRESSPSIRVFSAKEAGDVIREYMAFFFNCDKCSKRFVAQYDDCSFQRCHRLSDETVDAPMESWQELPLWLWQVHNDISRSKANRAVEYYEKLGKKAESKKWERDLQAVYPHIDQCIGCVSSSGTWNLDAVYKHLENEYWTFGYEIDPKMDKFLEYDVIERSSVSYGLGTYAFIAVGLVLAYFAKKRRIRATGWHKKVESSSFDRLPEKYRTS